MGGSLQRLEVLLIGLVLLLAGAVAAILMVFHSASSPAYIHATPVRVSTNITVEATVAPAAELAQIPPAEPMHRATAAPATVAPAATAAPATTPAPIATTAPAATATPEPTNGPATATAPTPTLAFNLSLVAVRAWPWLLLAVGVVGIGLTVLRMRKRRLGYTDQNMAQLLGAADAETRETNIRVMRDLAAKGMLTAELAAAAGIDLSKSAQGRKRLNLPAIRLPRPTMPRLKVPRMWPSMLQLPSIRLPRPTTPRVRPITLDLSLATPAPITLDLSLATPAPITPETNGTVHDPAPTTPTPIVAAPVIAAPLAARGLDVAVRDEIADPAPHDGVPAGEIVERPGVELLSHSTAGAEADAWTTEDRVLAVAGALAAVWVDEELTSPILALDTASVVGGGQVIVTIDQHPDEEELIVDLPDLLVERHPGWHASWRRDLLEVHISTDDARPPAGGPLVVPILAHGRGGKTTRFYPLASWRHLGLYGGKALGALHAVLGSLLFAQPPSNVALTILDNGEITPLYRDVAHLVPPPNSSRETLEQLAQAIRRSSSMVRPLLLVVVEPDDMLLNILMGITARLRAKPTSPVHLLIVQERLSIAGRELYAMLPALITAGGTGSPALLPGQGEWPKRGEARLVGRGMHVEGRAITLDEAEIAAMLAQLGRKGADLTPVLWDAPVHEALAPVVADDALSQGADKDTGDEQFPNDSDVDGDRPDGFISADQSDESEHGATHQMASPAMPAEAGERNRAQQDAEPALSDDTLRLLASLSRANADELPAAPPPQQNSRAADGQLPAEPQAGLLATPMVAPEPDNGWPAGPAPLGRVALAELMGHVVTHKDILYGKEGDTNSIGVTKNRLVDLLGMPKGQAKDVAEALMLWFDRAGILVEPARPGRLRHPRALATTDLMEIATRLIATPCPDAATVRAAWAESNEGRI